MKSIPEKITINGYEYKVVVEYKRKLNSSAKVYGDKIVLRLANTVSKKTQKEHVNFLLESISNKLTARNAKPLPFVLDLTKPIKVADKEYKVEIFYESRKSARMLLEDEDTFRIYLPQNLTHETTSKALIKLILMGLADDNRSYIEKRVLDINKRFFNYNITSIMFKNYKSKWGECNDNNEISINTMLLFCPDEILNYIIVHELSHIGLLNHSKEYWKRVEKVYYQREEAEKWLKANGSNYLNPVVNYKN